MQAETNNRKGGCFKLLGISLASIIILLIAIGFFGTIYQTNAQQDFLENNPPPGELIDIGGRNMHIYCVGSGSPTIILDAGQGGWSIDYMDLQSELSQTNQVCTYDRAGYGWSDMADDERTLDNITEDLHLLLNNAEIEVPYVLVGFSFSGLTSRYYYEQYPETFAGLVLLDPSVEGDRDLQSDDIRNAQQSLLGTYSAFEMASTVGLVRFIEPAEIAPYAPFIAIDPASPELYYEGVSNPSWWSTNRREFYTNQFADLPALPRNFDIPLTIVALSDSIPQMAELNEGHLALLSDLADESDNAELIVLDGVTHEGIVHEVDSVSIIIRELIEDL